MPGDEEDLALVEAIGDQPTERSEQQHRQELEAGGNGDVEAGAVQDEEDEVGLRDGLHPGARHGDDLAREVQAVVAHRDGPEGAAPGLADLAPGGSSNRCSSRATSSARLAAARRRRADRAGGPGRRPWRCGSGPARALAGRSCARAPLQPVADVGDARPPGRRRPGWRRSGSSSAAGRCSRAASSPRVGLPWRRTEASADAWAGDASPPSACWRSRRWSRLTKLRSRPATSSWVRVGSGVRVGMPPF